MKMIKKLATLLLAICLVLPCFSMVSFAADGKIMFEDPSTKTGETLEIKGVVQKSASTIGKVEVVMLYDTSYLDFKSGDGIVESESGKLTYTGDATNETGSRKEFKMTFDVLKEGTTKITIESATIKNASGTVMNYTHGSSTIKIAAGENVPVTVPDDKEEEEQTGVTDAKPVEINGAYYTFSNVIPENEIPNGYVASTLEYEWEERNVVYSEEFDLTLAYMIAADGTGEFYMYVEDDATFIPYEEIKVSDSVRIALLSDVSEVVLPSEYTSTEVVLNGHPFPAWQNQENPDYYIIYAVNNRGQASLYQLDNSEMTYQRFHAPEVEEEDDSLIGKLSDFLKEHMDYVILGTGLGFILFVLIIVVLSVKLYNRNAELDEVYDEYGIDEDEEDEEDEDDENEDEDYDDDVQEDNDGDKELEMFVQEGMKEVFPEEESVEEELVVEPVEKVTSNTVEIPIEKVVEKVAEKEDTLGEVLAKQKEEFYDEDEDVLDDFSMDFIDLDD